MPAGSADADRSRFRRERSFRNAPRVLDLDILLYQDTVLDDPQLLLPHPRMHQRAFVMVPLAEIAPDLPVGSMARLLPLPPHWIAVVCASWPSLPF
jgi:2-amino-4-hydroxy-6-hydroxymethyldihydropteridine diphosphokinase